MFQDKSAEMSTKLPFIYGQHYDWVLGQGLGIVELAVASVL